MKNNKRITIFTGYFGCGKTEIAINYAIKLIEEGKKTVLIDLDIVNLYYRSRQKKDELEKKGIIVVSSVSGLENADLPAISRNIDGYLCNEEYNVVVDLGGEESGALVLGRFPFLKDQADIFMVLNTNRPFVSTKEKILSARKVLENASGIQITGYITNVNLCDETTKEIIENGTKEIIEWFSNEIKYVTILKEYKNDFKDHFMEIPIFYIERYMKHQWEKGRITLDNKI